MRLKSQDILFWALIFVVHIFSLVMALSQDSYLIDDSIQYLVIADHIAHEGQVSQSFTEPIVSDAQRVPGYSIFLLMLGKMPALVLILQHLLTFLSGWLLYKSLCNYFDEKTARLTAYFYLVQPYAVIFGSLFLAESLFILFALLGLLAWTQWERSILDIKEKQKWGPLWLAFSFLGFGLGAYVKPIGIVFVFVAILLSLVVAIIRKATEISKSPSIVSEYSSLHTYTVAPFILSLVISFLLPALLLTPWIIRNKNLTGNASFSVMADMGMIHGRLGGLEAQKQGHSFNEHNLYMTGDSVAALKWGLENIKFYPEGQQNHETGTYHEGTSSLTIGHFLKNPVQGSLFQFRAIWQMLSGVAFGWANKLYCISWLAWLTALFQAFCNVLMYASVIFALLRIKKWPPVLHFSLALILLVLVGSAAAWADGRYRMILDPFFMLFFALVFDNRASKFRNSG